MTNNWETMSLQEKLAHLPRGLGIQPMMYDLEQRVEAVRLATEMGRGVKMEIGNSATRFYAVEEVPVGQIEVWAPKTYKGWLEKVTVLASAEETFGRAELDAWINSA